MLGLIGTWPGLSSANAVPASGRGDEELPHTAIPPHLLGASLALRCAWIRLPRQSQSPRDLLGSRLSQLVKWAFRSVVYTIFDAGMRVADAGPTEDNEGFCGNVAPCCCTRSCSRCRSCYICKDRLGGLEGSELVATFNRVAILVETSILHVNMAAQLLSLPGDDFRVAACPPSLFGRTKALRVMQSLWTAADVPATIGVHPWKDELQVGHSGESKLETPGSTGSTCDTLASKATISVSPLVKAILIKAILAPVHPHEEQTEANSSCKSREPLEACLPRHIDAANKRVAREKVAKAKRNRRRRKKR